MASVLPDPDESRHLAVGPDSIVWRRAGDVRALLGAGYALVLQVAHPTIAAGVREHSDFRADPWGRLLRTLDYVHLLVYGGPDAAARTGAAMRARHREIKGVAPDGTRYHALEPVAYAWVHATLAESITAAHRRFGRPLDDEQLDRFWREWRDLGRLLGIRERDLPVGWSAFAAYRDEMIATALEDNDVVQTVLDTLASPKAPPLPAPLQRAWPVARLPASRAQRLALTALAPPTLRTKLGLRLTAGERREVRMLGAILRRATPLLPASARTMGPAYLRWRADEIRTGQFGSASGTSARRAKSRAAASSGSVTAPVGTST